ncbi:hypothetical protein PVAP13_1KG542566 [Panicum virgatum]|uniref:Transmembrane protein n=1 Tax=Panicum virgatum TaxID=38727 RepID=A0A8T0XM33_PANVG|nr:hypothetical protein PVAP13_1KG542566 [Panicum virgatum]
MNGDSVRSGLFRCAAAARPLGQERPVPFFCAALLLPSQLPWRFCGRGSVSWAFVPRAFLFLFVWIFSVGLAPHACLCDTTSIWVGNRSTFRRVVATFANLFPLHLLIVPTKARRRLPELLHRRFLFSLQQPIERERGREEELFARRIFFPLLLLLLSPFVSCGLLLWPFPGPAQCDDEFLWHRSVLSSYFPIVLRALFSSGASWGIAPHVLIPPLPPRRIS